eukprot:363309-Chlamydomonas_euryale.AAC.38
MQGTVHAHGDAHLCGTPAMSRCPWQLGQCAAVRELTSLSRRSREPAAAENSTAARPGTLARVRLASSGRFGRRPEGIAPVAAELASRRRWRKTRVERKVRCADQEVVCRQGSQGRAYSRATMDQGFLRFLERGCEARSSALRAGFRVCAIGGTFQFSSCWPSQSPLCFDATLASLGGVCYRKPEKPEAPRPY